MGNLRKVTTAGVCVLVINVTMVFQVGAQESKAIQVIDQNGLEVQSHDLGELDQVGFCELQERLSALGFYQDKVNGIMGAPTATAIAEYELARNIKKTGLPSKQLLSRIRSNIRDRNVLMDDSSLQVSSSIPPTGAIFQNHLSSGLAPLQVVTADQGIHFFVKVQSVSETESYKTIFLRSGETVNEDLPLDSYIIKYAAGKHWHGEECLFGVTSVFSKADKVFEFTRQGNRISGYRVELILQIDGNLRTATISRRDF